MIAYVLRDFPAASSVRACCQYVTLSHCVNVMDMGIKMVYVYKIRGGLEMLRDAAFFFHKSY